MATAYTSDALLEDVRRGGSLPSASSTGTADADLLAHADAEIRDTLVPLMLGVHEEFYERVFDVTVTSGTAAYRINKRAAISRINTVQWLNTDNSIINLVRKEPKEVVGLALLSNALGQPFAYYLEGGRVVLYPTPNLSGTLRIRAFVRPGRLVLAADGANGTITAVTPSGSNYVLTIGTPAAGYSAGQALDVINATPSFEYIAVDAAISAADSTSVTIAASSCVTVPVITDRVASPDTSMFIQLPVELHPALTELTVARVLRALGKRTEAADHAEEAQRLVAIGIQALTPRVDTADRKILGGPHYRKGRGVGLWVAR